MSIYGGTYRDVQSPTCTTLPRGSELRSSKPNSNPMCAMKASLVVLVEMRGDSDGTQSSGLGASGHCSSCASAECTLE